MLIDLEPTYVAEDTVPTWGAVDGTLSDWVTATADEVELDLKV